MFARAPERISIKMHSSESRRVIAPSNILFASVCACIFQPGNLTEWGSEGVHFTSRIGSDVPRHWPQVSHCRSTWAGALHLAPGQSGRHNNCATELYPRSELFSRSFPFQRNVSPGKLHRSTSVVAVTPLMVVVSHYYYYQVIHQYG